MLLAHFKILQCGKLLWCLSYRALNSWTAVRDAMFFPHKAWTEPLQTLFLSMNRSTFGPLQQVAGRLRSKKRN